jgi:hypothetical protein
MDRFISVVGNVAAVIGLLMCFVSGAVRLMGDFHLYGYSAMTIYLTGTGLMVLACLCKLETLLIRSR